MKERLSYINKLFIYCSLLLFILIMVVSCSKDRNEYYSFKNKEQAFSGSTIEYLSSRNGEFDSMLLVLNRIGFISDSMKSAPVTVFAIPDQCFETVIQNLNVLRSSEGKNPLYLSTVDSSHLDTLICRYIIPGLYPTDSITYIDGMPLTSLKYGYMMNVQPIQVNASGFVNGGPQKLFFSDPKDSKYIRDWVRTTTQTVNIKTDDGYIHVLSGNHNFGFEEFVKRMNK